MANEMLRDEVVGTVIAGRCGRSALKKLARVSNFGSGVRSVMAKEVLCDKKGPRAAAHCDQSKRHHPANLGMLESGVGVGCRGRFHCAQVAGGHTTVGAGGEGVAPIHCDKRLSREVRSFMANEVLCDIGAASSSCALRSTEAASSCQFDILEGRLVFWCYSLSLR